MVKAICFDLDGVYFTESSFKNFAQDMSVNSDYDTAVQILKKSPEMASFKKGEMTEIEYWDFARKELKLDYSNEQIFELLRSSYEVNERVVEVVNKVRAMGYKTCICSNNFETRIREVDSKFDFLKNFDVKVFSYLVGSTKPSEEIFKYLVGAASVDPSELVYSDDSSEAVDTAKKIGINALYYEDFDGFIKYLNDLGVKI